MGLKPVLQLLLENLQVAAKGLERFMFTFPEVQFSGLGNPNPNCLNPKSQSKGAVSVRRT